MGHVTCASATVPPAQTGTQRAEKRQAVRPGGCCPLGAAPHVHCAGAVQGRLCTSSWRRRQRAATVGHDLSALQQATSEKRQAPCLDPNFFRFCTVTILFLFNKYYLIIEQLGLKDSSRDLQINYIISYLFYLYLMFHACGARFDVMENLVKLWVFRCI